MAGRVISLLLLLLLLPVLLSRKSAKQVEEVIVAGWLCRLWLALRLRNRVRAKDVVHVEGGRSAGVRSVLVGAEPSHGVLVVGALVLIATASPCVVCPARVIGLLAESVVRFRVRVL